MDGLAVDDRDTGAGADTAEGDLAIADCAEEPVPGSDAPIDGMIG